MEVLGLGRTDITVCKHCKYRFFCFTTRETVPLDGLCSEIGFGELSYETVKQMQTEKAKKQGRYFPTNKAD